MLFFHNVTRQHQLGSQLNACQDHGTCECYEQRIQTVSAASGNQRRMLHPSLCSSLSSFLALLSESTGYCRNTINEINGNGNGNKMKEKGNERKTLFALAKFGEVRGARVCVCDPFLSPGGLFRKQCPTEFWFPLNSVQARQARDSFHFIHSRQSFQPV